MLSEAEKIKRAIQRVADAEIQKLTAPCFRVFKAVVTQAPNGSTCNVRLIGDDTILTLPYADKLETINVGAFVWVAGLYATNNSLSSAIVWDTLNFEDLNSVYAYTAKGVKSTNGVINVPVDLNKYRITYISVANVDFNAGSLGVTAQFVYTDETYLYKTNTVGEYVTLSSSSSPANSCNVEFFVSESTWNNNNNMSVLVNYTKK